MFGWLRRKKSKVTIVTTKEELKAAVKRKEPLIEVRGELVNKMKWMGKLMPNKIMVLTGILTTAALVNPITGPTAAGVASINTFAEIGVKSTGATTAEIITLIRIIGVVTIVAMLMDYTIEFSKGDISIRLIAKNGIVAE